MVYLEGLWVGLELLAGPDLFARAWPRLCAGYAADAIGRKAARRRVPSSATVLANLAACPTEAVNAVGLGAEYRFIGKTIAGAGLVADDRVAHLMAFPRTTHH